MKTCKLLVRTLTVLAVGLGLNYVVVAQKAALPPDVTHKSSLGDVLNLLDAASFGSARIGLESNAAGVAEGEVPTTATRYYEQAFFSKGFRLAKIEGCKITLKNDDVKLLRFETKYPNPAEGSLDAFGRSQNGQAKFTGELSIPLQSLKPNKPPFRHTKKPETEALLGAWRTEFKFRPAGFIIPTKQKMESMLANQLKIEVSGGGQSGRGETMSGDELTFTFDDEQAGESFYAAFTRAIKLCEDK
jgi:hypothetical protein